jgi:hypothetical protein
MTSWHDTLLFIESVSLHPYSCLSKATSTLFARPLGGRIAFHSIPGNSTKLGTRVRNWPLSPVFRGCGVALLARLTWLRAWSMVLVTDHRHGHGQQDAERRRGRLGATRLAVGSARNPALHRARGSPGKQAMSAHYPGLMRPTQLTIRQSRQFYLCVHTVKYTHKEKMLW